MLRKRDGKAVLTNTMPARTQSAARSSQLSDNRAPIGKTYPPFEYEVGREKIREYANVVGETNPVHRDPEAARAAGFSNVVAPPMFAVVYSAGAMGPAILDPELKINLMMMVHGSQEFEWLEPVVAGDTITTTAKVKDIYDKNGMKFYVWESESRNQNGDTVVKALWTNIVRGG
jgi:acyl dehydratase